MNWREFEDRLARRRGAGETPRFWWRDDDAAQPTPELERLLVLARTRGVPVALAVVPRLAVADLFDGLWEEASILQHGTDHRNRAAPGEKKTEFPAGESNEAALARLAAGRERLRLLAGERAAPVLVPPWNRIRQDLAAKLPSIGIRGLSTYGPQAAGVAGLAQANTHVDIVAWHEGRRFIGEGEALGLAARSLEAGGALGWLTHHAVHDEAAWDFLERLLALQGVRWANAPELFSYTGPAHA